MADLLSDLTVLVLVAIPVMALCAVTAWACERDEARRRERPATTSAADPVSGPYACCVRCRRERLKSQCDQVGPRAWICRPIGDGCRSQLREVA